MDTERLYHAYRNLLFSLAYRMLGSVMDAEDVVQEAFFTMNQLPEETKIQNEKAYLCKLVTNRCLNLLRSSSKQREVYVGTWLPEPLVQTDRSKQDPAEIYQQRELISTAYLLLLQQLSAMERAIFLLRELFQYPFSEIADIVGKSNTNCRQIYYRAKKSIDHKTTTETKDQATKLQVQQFVYSLLEGNIERLKELVTKDVVHYTDGGGKVQAVLHPVRGITKVILLYKRLMNWFKNPDKDYSYQFAEVNGNPGFVLTIDKQLTYVYSFESSNGKIQAIYAVANPDKLKHLSLGE